MIYIGEYSVNVRNKRIELPSKWYTDEIRNMTLYCVEYNETHNLVLSGDEPSDEYDSLGSVERVETVFEGNKLVLPDSVYKKLPLKKAVLVGIGDGIEIYSEDEYKKFINSTNVDDMIDVLKEIGF